MKIILDEEEKKTLEENAREFDVEPEKLLEAYEQATSDDLEQDLWDILTYNWKELGGRNFEQEDYEKELERNGE